MCSADSGHDQHVKGGGVKGAWGALPVRSLAPVRMNEKFNLFLQSSYVDDLTIMPPL